MNKKSSKNNRPKTVKYKDYVSDLSKIDFSKLDIKKRIEILKLQNKKIVDPVEQKYQTAKATFKNAKKKEKQLHGDSTNLTNQQVQIIIKTVIQHNTEASYLLALTLFSGQNIVDNPGRIKVGLTRNIEYSFLPNVKQNKISEGIEKLYHPVENIITLPLPKFFANFQKRNKDNDVKELLDVLNKKLCRIITVNQVSNYMSYWMNNHGYDSTEINLLSRTADKLSGTNYYLTSINNLSQAYQNYQSHLCLISDIEMGNQTQMLFGNIGSNVVAKSQHVSSFFDGLVSKLKKQNLNNKDEISKHHNLLTMHTVQMLKLCTGLRPVDHPFMNLDYFDLLSNRIFINDKSSKFVENHRVLILPQIAVKQVQAYLLYLKSLRKLFSFVDSDIAFTVDKILTNQSPIFHFFTSKLRPIQNRKLTRKMKSLFPVKSNWNRHFMRTKLREYGLDGQSVDLWMGHEGVGGSGLGKHAASSFQQLMNVANVVENIVGDLGIQVIKGRLN